MVSIFSNDSNMICKEKEKNNYTVIFTNVLKSRSLKGKKKRKKMKETSSR